MDTIAAIFAKLEHPAGKHEGSRADERTGFHCLLQEGKHCAEIGLTPDECARSGGSIRRG